jgi:quinol monooxygenase YgiN
MIVIAGELIVGLDHAEELRGRVMEYAKNSLAEPGCVRFDVAEDSEQAGRFLIWANYVNFEAVDAHRAQLYRDQFFESTASITKSQTLSLLELITPTDQDG